MVNGCKLCPSAIGAGSPPHGGADRNEQIAADTRDALRELRTDIRDLRGEMRDLRSEMRDLRGDMNNLRSDMNRQFRWLVGIWLSSLGATLAVMAHGFGWL